LRLELVIQALLDTLRWGWKYFEVFSEDTPICALSEFITLILYISRKNFHI